jgi:hypothetical protein
MRSRVLFFGCVFLFCSLFATFAQGPGEDRNNPFRGLIARMTPDARLKYERLRRAEFASLEVIRTRLDYQETADTLKAPFQEGDRIIFSLLITNNSIEDIVFARVDPFQEQRLDLTRDGDLLPYLKSVSALLIQKDKAILGRRVRPITLPPGETTEELVALPDWYGRLQPGHYQLTVRRRFIYGGDWISSPAITFDVNPRDRETKEKMHEASS